MGGDYPKAEFPDNPVLVGPLASADYQIFDDPAWPGTERNTVTPTVAVADHVGNHVWSVLNVLHGGQTYETQWTSPYEEKLDTGNTAARYNYVIGQVWVAGENYFEGEPHFSATNPDVAGQSYVAEPDDSWLDGGSGTLHVDYEDWSILGGVAAISWVVQAPESARPFNDDQAAAYTLTECPVTLVECVFGQTAEGGETFDGLGDIDTNTSVWFRYTPTNSEVGVPIRTGLSATDPVLGEFTDYITEYDTILVVYDSSLAVIASDDDSDTGDASMVTVDVTGGETYYIQVTGFAGDEGRLLLTIGSEGACSPADYWGILTEAV
jgi:hypothetical protein